MLGRPEGEARGARKEGPIHREVRGRSAGDAGEMARRGNGLCGGAVGGEGNGERQDGRL